MSLLNKLLPALATLVLMAMGSCVKDIDLDQASRISLQPKIQADLLIFTVDEKDFVTQEPPYRFKAVIKDTVRLEFLDDSYIQKDLEQVEFSFKYLNSFPQNFTSTIYFLSENNRVQHEVDFFIEEGSLANPTISENIDIIGPDRIDIIKRSIKMVVEIEVLPNSEPFTGELNFQSKGLFLFQF